MKRGWELAKAYEAQAVAWRRHLHSHPELSFEEFETASFVAEHLESMGYSVRRNVGGTGVMGTLETGRPGPVVAFRADIDALPVLEQTGLPFASVRSGVMHACGHDIHTSVLLGTAAILAELRSRLCGTIKLIFQPGEEANGGARCVIEDGVLRAPEVEAVFALHVLPDLPAGMVGLREGYLSATDDELLIRVNGVSAHSSTPQEGVNAITVAAHILTALESIESSAISPFEVATCSICKIQGGETNNIIPDHAELRGMLRCLDKNTKALYRERIQRICTGTAQALGAEVEVEFTAGFPAVCNDPALTRQAAAAVENALEGVGGVTWLPRPNLGSEDFSYFQEQVPGVMLVLGCGTPGEDRGGLHDADFTPDEACIPVGMACHTAIALALCGADKLM
mgnify:FL=1